MKKILFFVTFLCVAVTMLVAQPSKMTWQFVVRDASGALVVNQNVGARISILQDSANGAAVFAEMHAVTTNANALATFKIGTGTPVVAFPLTDIDWGNHDW